MPKTRLTLIIVIAIVGYLLFLSLIFLLFKTRHQVSHDAIAVIEVDGVINDAKNIVRQLKKYSNESKIKGILLRIESPGGTVVAAQEIYSELKRTKQKGKRLVVSMGSVATSGGYYIATPADIIVANPGTITGSIGVIMNFPVIEELLKKIGIKFEVIKSNEHKDLGSPFRTPTSKERELLSSLTWDIYQQFLDAIKENRPISEETLNKITQGQIFSGKQAQQYGLVDSLGSYEDAIIILSNLCGIKNTPHIIKERLPRTFARFFNRLAFDFILPKPFYLCSYFK
jgi:protease-4